MSSVTDVRLGDLNHCNACVVKQLGGRFVLEVSYQCWTIARVEISEGYANVVRARIAEIISEGVIERAKL